MGNPKKQSKRYTAPGTRPAGWKPSSHVHGPGCDHDHGDDHGVGRPESEPATEPNG